MFAALIFLLILFLIIGLFYAAEQLKKRTNINTAFVWIIYFIAVVVTALWLYYGFLFVTIIMKGV